MACLFGHKWNGCKCSKCGKTRDEQHSWKGCKCEACGKTQNHNWDGCKCVNCGITRDSQHSWSVVKPHFATCSKCNIERIHISGFSPAEKGVLGFAGAAYAMFQKDTQAADLFKPDNILKQDYLDATAFGYAVVSLESFGEDIVKNIKSQLLVGKEEETYRSTLTKAQEIKRILLGE